MPSSKPLSLDAVPAAIHLARAVRLGCLRPGLASSEHADAMEWAGPREGGRLERSPAGMSWRSAREGRRRHLKPFNNIINKTISSSGGSSSSAGEG
jgi:hypothetical protein